MGPLSTLLRPNALAETAEQVHVATLRSVIEGERETSTLLAEQLDESLTGATGRLAESVTRLEQLVAEDVGWLRLTALAEQEFSRAGLRQITSLCRIMWIKNPLIRRGLNLKAHYVFGQGVELGSEQELVQQLVEDLTDDPGNRQAVFGAKALEDMERALGTDGNVFIVLWTDPVTGRVRTRTLDADEIADAMPVDGDPTMVRYWVRQWVDAAGIQHRNLHPDVTYRPTSRPANLDGDPIMWDAPIVAVQVGSPKGWRFGIPEAYPAIDWARAYTRFLEDWLSYVKSLARFAWTHKTKGRRVSTVKAAHEARYEQVDEDGRATPAGSTAVLAGAGDLQPVNHTGAHVTAESGRPTVLMVASALEVPYGWISGDPDVGNLATAKTLDRPTELAFGHRQDLWRDVLKTILRYCVRSAAVAPRGRLAGTVTVTADDWAERILVDGEPLSLTIDFPELTEHSVNEMVEAIKWAHETGTMPPEQTLRMLLQAFGVDDVDQVIDDFLDQAQAARDGDEAEQAAEALLAQAIEKLAEATGG